MLHVSAESGAPKLTTRPIPLYRCLLLAIALLIAAGPALAQNSSSPPSQSAQATSSATPAQKQDVSAKPDQSQDQKPAASPEAKPMTPEEARQAQIVADTNRLYQLAQELQAEVAKSNKNTLSLAVVKKAAEVEKLAKSLKERMKPE